MPLPPVNVNTADTSAGLSVTTKVAPTQDLLFRSAPVNSTTLTAEATVGAYTIDVAVATGLAPGDLIIFGNAATNRLTQATILSIATLELTLDIANDFAYPIGTVVEERTTDMAVDGGTTPVVFSVLGDWFAEGLHVTRLMWQILTATAPIMEEFGDLTALTNGVTMHKYSVADGNRNLWNIKANSDLVLLSFDLTVYEAASPLAADGIAARYTFSGMDKHGSPVILLPGERLDITVQDTLTGLDSMRALVQGKAIN